MKLPPCIDRGKPPCPTCPVHTQCDHGRKVIDVTEVKALANPFLTKPRKKGGVSL